ncbi:ATP-grasp domain-containing protein [Ornithinibacillus halophilus]|uniref:Gamma-F420-2:alpha-L-glutamate ligase n=1 Tax=Ornithinibacillus halophilus TaxID=930117 RepID=A0A1M5DDL3_9BACI|nr:ATP-grasp domain-containing protein [Ornithinibacillus halophilus]SHF65077.1 gamma-F420-2:alpha-L-glutamate ligase [Ornithinibacillus halophilus]
MNKEGWIIYQEQDAIENESYINWFIEEAEKQQLSLKLVLRENIQFGIKNNNLTLSSSLETAMPDFAIVRTIEPLLNLQLEQLGVAVYNSSTIASICNHKGRTHFEVNKLNIPMVDTYFYKRELLLNPPLKFPFVIKEASGRGGKQVYFIQNEDDWKNCIASISTTDVIVQDSNVQLGKDLRVFVVGKIIIGAVLRESSNDFRANFKLGGTARLYELNSQEKEIIEKIVHHFEFGMVGIDFLLDSDGNLLFNEIEDVVGSRTLSHVSDINIVEKYVEHIKRNC